MANALANSPSAEAERLLEVDFQPWQRRLLDQLLKRDENGRYVNRLRSIGL